MNDREAQQFAQKIKKQAWHQVRVRVGRTNGMHTFHITDTQAADKSRASTTIYNEGEWLIHPLNSINRPTKRDEGLAEYVHEFTDLTAGIQASFGRLTEAAVSAAAKAAALRAPLDTPKEVQ